MLTILKKSGSCLLHTLNGALLVPIVTAAFSISVAGMFGYAHQMRYVLTEMHWFPVQPLVAILVGYGITRGTKSDLGRWAWIIPAATLIVVFPSLPFVSPLERALPPLSFSQRLSDLFGPRCSVFRRCFDQVVLTMPFYSSIGYSIGALLASPAASSVRVKHGISGAAGTRS